MKINKSEYEDLVRDSERFAIVSAVLNHYEFVSDDLLRIICGLQVNKTPEDEIVEAPTSESTEDSDREARAKLYEDLLEENYELREETPSEIKNPASSASSSSTEKKGIDKGKVVALYNAGWSQTKIADEMGCSVQRVHQIVKESYGKEQ